MNVFVRDKLFRDGRSPIGEQLAKGGLIHLDTAAVQHHAACVPSDEPDAVKDAASIIFLHHDNNLDVWHRQIETFRGHLVVISSLGKVTIPDQFNHLRIHPCFWKPEDFGNCNPVPRVARFVEQLKGANIDTIDWDLLQPENSEAIMTAKLLTEAYGDGAGDSVRLFGGIAVHCPPDAVYQKAQLLKAKADTDNNDLEPEIEALQSALKTALSPGGA